MIPWFPEGCLLKTLAILYLFVCTVINLDGLYKLNSDSSNSDWIQHILFALFWPIVPLIELVKYLLKFVNKEVEGCYKLKGINYGYGKFYTIEGDEAGYYLNLALVIWKFNFLFKTQFKKNTGE